MSGQENINNLDALNATIKEIEKKISEVSELQAVEEILESDANGIRLKDVIESHPDIAEFLLQENLPVLRKSLWISYINANRAVFDELKLAYDSLADKIDKLDVEHTAWKEALDIFKSRFFVPFDMEIGNLQEAIIGEGVPQILFRFSKNGKQSDPVTCDVMDARDTLSQGEKRALYLLNIIFDIEKIKQSGKETLLIIDDIADSFDYKNKYAIVEYLYELAFEPNIKMIILTHNFDFYRTITSRLPIPRKGCQLMANTKRGKLVIEGAEYLNSPLKYWTEKPCKKNILAMVPFVRNLAEYRDIPKGSNKNAGDDYLLLTSILHKKQDSAEIVFSDLLKIYPRYTGIHSFGDNINLDDSVVSAIIGIGDTLTEDDARLEDKIILAMAIRYKAESFVQERILQSGIPGASDLINKIQSNQTRKLVEIYKNIDSDRYSQANKLLDEVDIMTPENIHANSFMYEPILDMDIVELLELYHKITELQGAVTV